MLVRTGGTGGGITARGQKYEAPTSQENPQEQEEPDKNWTLFRFPRWAGTWHSLENLVGIQKVNSEKPGRHISIIPERKETATLKSPGSAFR
jgi:hypothetical protein